MLHSLMPRMLRKTGEKTKASMALHQIDVDKKVIDTLHRFKSESRARKKEKAVQERTALMGKNEDGTDPLVNESSLIVHEHDDE